MRSEINRRLILGCLKSILGMVDLSEEVGDVLCVQLLDMNQEERVVEIMEQKRVVWARQYNSPLGFQR